MNSLYPPNVCSQITPIGRGAIAVVAIHGAFAGTTIDECLLTPGRELFTSRKHQDVAYGIWKPTGEDLVISKRGEMHFEIHCHGGTTASQAIIGSLGSFGFVEVSATEFANQFQDFWNVTTQLALTESTTSKTALFLLRLVTQLPQQIQKIRKHLATNEPKVAAARIQSMLGWSNFGQHLTAPRNVVLCGQPNVGKSSLVNAIAGFQRSIVHDIAGTTRDVVSQAIAIDGWPVTLKDTAGIRNSDNPIEIEGIAQAKAQILKSDLTICVFDAQASRQSERAEIISQTQPDIIVLNKTDLLPPNHVAINDSASDLPTVKTSVKSNEGIQKLIGIIGSQLVPEIPSKSQAYPVTVEQHRRLSKSLDYLKQKSPDALKRSLDCLDRPSTIADQKS